MKYNFIKQHLKHWPVQLMCKVIEASRSGFYRWMKKQRGYIRPYDRYLLIRIKEAYQQSNGTYGSRRIYKQLKRCGVHCYLNQIEKIMKDNGIKAKTRRRFRITTNSKHNLKISPNLLQRNFSTSEINKVWVGDITYIWTRQGWLYLSTVIDLFSRKVVGWSLDRRMTKSLVISSLKAALDLRRPTQGLIFHSDRGSQYASDDFRDILRDNDAVPSMSRKGNCWDNAVAESFFKTIKSELIYWHNFQTRAEAELRIFEYIELFYNRQRLHSTINYMSPDAFENRCLS
jgi:putative transposase